MQKAVDGSELHRAIRDTPRLRMMASHRVFLLLFRKRKSIDLIRIEP